MANAATANIVGGGHTQMGVSILSAQMRKCRADELAHRSLPNMPTSGDVLKEDEISSPLLSEIRMSNYI